jgi:hypothetical protein
VELLSVLRVSIRGRAVARSHPVRVRSGVVGQMDTRVRTRGWRVVVVVVVIAKAVAACMP